MICVLLCMHGCHSLCCARGALKMSYLPKKMSHSLRTRSCTGTLSWRTRRDAEAAGASRVCHPFPAMAEGALYLKSLETESAKSTQNLKKPDDRRRVMVCANTARSCVFIVICKCPDISACIHSHTRSDAEQSVPEHWR